MTKNYFRGFIFLFIIFFASCSINVPLIKPAAELEEKLIEGEGRAKILVIDISGFISDRERSDRLKLRTRPSIIAEIGESLKKAREDSELSGLIVRINSPGGKVSASDTIYHELRRFRKKKDIPVYACITGIGTSGAYYIAAAADRVFAHPTAITGSIGVIALKFNIEGLMTKLGIEDETFKSGDKKDLFSPFRPITPEEREILQSVIDDLHQRFVDVVYEERKDLLTRQELEDLSDGRIYTAGSARDLHLIDHTGYIDDAVNMMKESLGVEDARIVVYHRPGDYVGTLYSSSSSLETSLIDHLSEYTDGNLPVPGIAFLYLWNP